MITFETVLYGLMVKCFAVNMLNGNKLWTQCFKRADPEGINLEKKNS